MPVMPSFRRRSISRSAATRVTGFAVGCMHACMHAEFNSHHPHVCWPALMKTRQISQLSLILAQSFRWIESVARYSRLRARALDYDARVGMCRHKPSCESRRLKILFLFES
jgi:hypothetical protein